MRKPKTTTIAPNSRAIVRNLILRKDGSILAGYRRGPARWDYTGEAAQTARILQDADVYGHLTGRELRINVSPRPHPVQQWAAQLDARTPHPTPDVHTCSMTMDRGDLLRGRCGCETWNGHLVRMQERIVGTGMDDKVVFIYLSLLPRVKASIDLNKEIKEYLATGTASEAVLAVIEDEKRVADVVTGWPGSRRMSEYEQGWLRARSVSPGSDALNVKAAGRDGWDELAMPMLSADTRWYETPFGRSVTVRSYETGQEVRTAVRVLSLARAGDLHYPENGMPPWMTHAESVRDATGRPFSVSWSVVGRLLAGEVLEKQVELELRRTQFIKRDYREHEELPPASVDRAFQTAVSTRDQVTTGQAMEAARFLGQVNVIITGQDRFNEAGQLVLSAADVVEERSAAFVRHYSNSGLRMDFAGADAQAFMLQSTIPGEPWDTVGYQRRMRLPYLACGMPNVSADVGDSRGPYIGHTRGATIRPVMHDSHYATEGKRTGRSQNMHLIVATLGGGKSVLVGSLIYNLVRRGIATLVEDPSGPLAELCRMPEIAAVSQEVNLLTGRRGILSPASLISDPHKEDFPEPGDWSDALERTEAERRELMIDAAMRCLPYDLVTDRSPEEQRTRAVLREATRRYSQQMNGWQVSSSMWDLVDHLNALNDPHATSVAGALEDASRMPLMRLLFPERGAAYVEPDHYTRTLTVITTPGIARAADGTPRSDWTPMEQGADVVLRMVSLYTSRMVYNKPRSQRMSVFFDEAESKTDFSPGRSMLSRLGRDHSKWNLGVYLATKTVNDQMLSGELKNFIASVFAGRMASEDPARSVLELLGLHDEHYVSTLLNLSSVVPGEFVHMDVDGRIGSLKVDVDYHPRLKAALLTDPTPEGSNNWELLEENL